MVFQEKYFSRYIPLPEQISFSDYLYFFRYWAKRLLPGLPLPLPDLKGQNLPKTENMTYKFMQCFRMHDRINAKNLKNHKNKNNK